MLVGLGFLHNVGWSRTDKQYWLVAEDQPKGKISTSKQLDIILKINYFQPILLLDLIILI